MADSKLFEGQHDAEEVLLVFRRHPVVMRKGFYLMLAPFMLGTLVVLVRPENLAMLWFPVGGLAIGILLFFYHWMGWYFSIFIITDQRLRQITQRGFFNRSVLDVGISKIQNISYSVPGFSASVLGFGDIVVQTYVGDLYLDRIHHPAKIYEQLLSIVREFGANSSGIYEEATS